MLLREYLKEWTKEDLLNEAIFLFVTPVIANKLGAKRTLILAGTIMSIRIIGSSFLDNIPFVATLIPMILTMQAEGMDVTPIWWALSLGACLGGNGTLIGASANVVLSGISKNNGHPITFGQYFKIGFPMMILSIIVCSVFLLIRFA